MHKLLFFCLVCVQVQAGPLLAPGDIALRHHISILADAGVIDAPITSWPISTASLYLQAMESRTYTGMVKVSINYLKKAIKNSGIDDQQIGLAVANQDLGYTHFALGNDALRQVYLATAKNFKKVSLSLQFAVLEPQHNDSDVRLDGSFVAAQVGNWLLSVDKMHRWWGPGWDGSLIYSNNAQAIPSISLQRLRTQAFRNRFLAWLGPWDLTLSMAQLERSRVIPRALFFASRLAIKPWPSLEIGFSRSAQWGGKGRPQDLDTFMRLLVGADNVGQNGATAENQPGNQLAGYDIRWKLPMFRLPLAVYAQGMGEDEADGFPVNFIGLFGLEWWSQNYRVFLEHTDTRSRFAHHDPEFNVAYEHSVYGSGYRYRGRSIGHTLDSDGKMWSIGLAMVRSGSWWQLVLRRIKPDVFTNQLKRINIGLISAFNFANNEVSGGWLWTHDSYLTIPGNRDSLLAHIKWTRTF